jgi:alkaline phosphatase
MIGCTVDLHRAVEAVLDFVDEPGDDVTWSNTTLLVTADHANSLMRFEKALGAGDLPAFDELALGADRYPDHEITYGTSTHTSELVTLRARGRAAPRVTDYMTQFPGLEIVDDTAIYALTLDTVER